MADATAARRGECDGRPHGTVLKLYSAMNNLRTTGWEHTSYKHASTRYYPRPVVVRLEVLSPVVCLVVR